MKRLLAGVTALAIAAAAAGSFACAEYYYNGNNGYTGRFVRTADELLSDPGRWGRDHWRAFWERNGNEAG